MKRSLLVLSSIVLFSAMSFASVAPDWFGIFDKNHNKRHQPLPESGAVPMLVLSLGVIAGGLTLRQRLASKS
jgi:hypothetical protein